MKLETIKNCPFSAYQQSSATMCTSTHAATSSSLSIPGTRTSKTLITYLSARETYYELKVYDLHRLCGYIFSCRKIYAEARLLIFQLNTFHIRSSSVPHLPRVLHEAYGSVNTSIQTDYEVLIYGDAVYNDTAALLGTFTRLREILTPGCPPPWPSPDFPWPILEQDLYITVERRIGGSCLRTKLEELTEIENEILCENDLEDMVSRLILNLGWMDLELVDIELIYD